MNKARFNAIHGGLSSLAQKVYAAVPIAEAWSSEKISREYSRINISSQPKKSIEGMLNILVESGLVVENASGNFVRIRIKEPAIKEKTAMPSPVAQKTVDKTADPLDLLAGLARRAKVLALQGAQLGKDAAKLETDIENAALDIAEKFQGSEEKSRKLTQLQELLKGLTE
jgi:hypothetical protein